LITNFLPMKKTLPFVFVVILALTGAWLNTTLLVKPLTSKLESKMQPSDWFFMQRSYPDAKPNIEAYKNALASIQTHWKSSRQGVNTPWTVEGPGNIGGRINCIAIHPNNPAIIFVGNTAGGIFKTTNTGASWYPVFDDQPYLAIACIEFDPLNPTVMYAGTGDPNISGFPFIGNGVYKSIDGGESWQLSGLSNTGIVTKIRIHPQNTSIIYAATMGIPFERNNERGLYKSTDGGNSWTQILFLNNDAGVIDFLINPANPDILYACGWNRIRNNQESLIAGPHCKLYRSTDGGQNWAAVAGGFPQSGNSRIGLVNSSLNPNTVFAVVVDSASLDLKGIYKSNDAGINWSSIDVSGLNPGVLGFFGWYFGKIAVNPQNDNEIYLLGVDLWKTTNSGQSWQIGAPDWFTYDVHADKHDLKFVNASSFYLATDGGLYFNPNLGMNYTDAENIPNTQFYRVAANPHQPSVYYGGAQDNGTTGGNAAIFVQWQRIFGGDGFQTVFHPTLPDCFYAETQNGGIYGTDDGGVFWFDATDGIDGSDRRNWDMPYIMSKHNPDVMYAGTYRIYKSTSGIYPFYQPVSIDLTDGVVFGERFHTISTIAESPVSANRLYAGTSDANVWTSPNAGQTWVNITGNLPNRYVTHITCSPFDANTAYVSHSGYRDNDNTPRIHKTTNAGQNWISISGNLPNLAINNMLVHPLNEQVIFVATDGGVYATFDGGTQWDRLGVDMPVIPVYDIELNIFNNKLLAGTFARSMMSFPLDSVQQLITSISKNQLEDGIRLYPNPSAGNELFIELSSGIQSIELYNSGGRLVEQIVAAKTSETKLRINTQHLSSGLYYIRFVTSDGQSKVKKWVKI
jgi:photosystem II stability/assembly factor-like uncharacterized protein